MSMFDYFSNKAGRMQPPGVITHPQRAEDDLIRRLAARGMFVPEQSTGAGAAGDVAPATGAVRPRLAPPSAVPPPAVAAPQMSDPERQLQAARLRTAGYRDITGPAVYDQQGRQTAGKPVNNDHGVLGRIGDVLRQAVISAGEGYNNTQGDPGQRLLGALGGGIAGGIGGGFNPAMDEQRQRLRDIGRSEGEEQRYMGIMNQDQGLALRQAQTQDVLSQPYLKQAEINAKNFNTISDSHRDRATNLYQRWEKTPGFDPNSSDPEIVQMVLEGKQLGMALPKHEPNKSYSLAWSPDGKAAKIEKNSGTTTLEFGGQSFAKPTPVGEIPDSMFGDVGLLGKDEITRNALADLPEDVRGGLQLSPEAERFLSQVQSTDEGTGQPYLKYVNPEGGLNEAKVVQDAAIGLLQLPAGTQLYANEMNATRAKSKLARLEQQYGNSQKPIRAEVDRLRMLLKGKPSSVADEAITYYKQAKASKNKKALEELFKSLS